MENAKIKIAFFDTKPYDRKFFDAANHNHAYDIKYFEPRLSPDTVSMTAGFDAVCVFVNDNVNDKVIDRLVGGGVKLLVLRCAGYNNVSLYAAHNRLAVARVPAYSPYAVAEHAAALLLTLVRRTHRAYNRTRDNNFSINGLLGFDIHGKTVGIVGTGKIGRIFARIMRGFDARVIAYDAHPDPEFAAANNIEFVDLITLYRQSDIISLHCPLTPDTYHMISGKAIAHLKPGVILINTSRGQLIDTAVLVEALKDGLVGGAGLDVYEEESDYFFEDLSGSLIEDDVLARLMTFHNVLVTSHQGFFTQEALTNIAATTLKNVDDFFHGRELVNGICCKCDGSRPCPGKPHGEHCR